LATANPAIEYDAALINAKEAEVAQMGDDAIIERIRERFQILDDMTRAVKQGNVRAMIVSGPPGVGKSYGVDRILDRDDLFTKIAGEEPKFEFVKGRMSPLGLYTKFWEHKDKGHVVVFDDCDNVLHDEISLNILKGALDSGDKRTISWNTDARVLRSEDIPKSFDFEGSAIFITNVKFEHVKSKSLKDHLAALESRCHYIDLTMDTNREKMLRIKQIVGDGMLNKYQFEDEVQQEIVAYIEENQDKLRELSLRMVLKISDLYKTMPSTWKKVAGITCMKRGTYA
jgi:hypothetical protein